MSPSLTTLVKESENTLISICSSSLVFWKKSCVVVERSKVTVTVSEFMVEENVYPITVNDLLTVTCTRSPLFASVTLTVKLAREQPIMITHLSWNDAKRLTEVLTGLMVATNKQTSLEPERSSQTVAAQLQQVGKLQVS